MSPHAISPQSDVLSCFKAYVLLITSIYAILSSIRLGHVWDDYLFSLNS